MRSPQVLTLIIHLVETEAAEESKRTKVALNYELYELIKLYHHSDTTIRQLAADIIDSLSANST